MRNKRDNSGEQSTVWFSIIPIVNRGEQKPFDSKYFSLLIDFI